MLPLRGISEMENRTYIAIDLKSFYASVECVDRGLDPLRTNLVVADESRTEKTICLAVSPSLKEQGIAARPRLFEVIRRVREVNRERLAAYRRQKQDRQAELGGESVDARELAADPSLMLGYLVAPPRMKRYMEVSALIYSIYLKYVSREDVIVYSIDEVFIDVTDYLNTCRMTGREMAMQMIREVQSVTGITATAGIGTNLFLAKVAMDIVAKHIRPDENGVRLAQLDEDSFRRLLWDHRPLTDFWRIGPGIARKLEENGMFTLGDVARMSVRRESVWVRIAKPNKKEEPVQLMNTGEDLLYKLFGVNAELLIDHAWGWEPCTVREIKRYRPQSRSLGSGQVLHEPYPFEKAEIIVKEMADELGNELLRRGLAAERIELYIGYDRESLKEDGGVYRYRDGRIYKGQVHRDHYGRLIPGHAAGNAQLELPTALSRLLSEAAAGIFEQKADPDLLVRRINITACGVITEEEAERRIEERRKAPVQLSLFADQEALDQEQSRRDQELRRERRLQKAMLEIKEKYGKNAVLRGIHYEEGARGRERNREIGGHKA